MPSTFTYHDPQTRSLLIFSSYLYLLNLFGWLAQSLVSAGLLGQILIGIIYGSPLAEWLEVEWQETLVAMGYVGLLLIVFEGGMTTSLSTLTPLLPLSVAIALTGLLTPIAISFLLTPMFSFPLLHSFAAGAALSSTSLGTVLAVLGSPSIGFKLQQTRLGTALLGAAVMDDVVAFVLSKILNLLGSSNGGAGLGASIGRTIGVTVALGLLAIPFARFCLAPIYKRYWSNRWRVAGGDGLSIALLSALFIGFIAVAGYAGTSPLYGVYIAGLIVSYLDALGTRRNPTLGKDDDDMATTTSALELNAFGSDFHPMRRTLSLPSRLASRPVNPQTYMPIAQSSLLSAFESYISPILNYLLLPLFFGSIGYSIPFIPLFRPRNIWKGIIYSLLMILSKGICGVWIWTWSSSGAGARGLRGRIRSSWWGGILLGCAMIARGEIGLLISQIAYQTSDPLLSEDEFLIITWAIVLCTIVGPMGVGWVVKRKGVAVVNGGWD